MREAHHSRLAMFQGALDTLYSLVHQGVWLNRTPTVFAAKLHRAAEAVSELAAACSEHKRDTTETAERTRREGVELEETVHLSGSALAVWFRDQGNAHRAAEVDLTRSEWRGLRDSTFLEKCRLVRSETQKVLDESELEAAGYGLTTDALWELTRAIDNYSAVVTAPQPRVADRTARTETINELFRAVESQFHALDRLILQFGNTTAGRDLIAAYHASRNVRDWGSASCGAADPLAALPAT